MRYTTILHQARVDLGLSMNDYCIADLIHHYSSNPKGTVIGWCYASKQHIADQLGISKVWVINSIASLEQKGILEKSPDGRLLRTTGKWFSTVISDFTDGKESLPTSVNGVNQIGKESLPPSNSKNNSKIESEKLIFPFNTILFINKWDEFVKYRKEIKKPFKAMKSQQAALNELGKFTEIIALAAIEKTIANGWQGLFPEKIADQMKQQKGRQQGEIDMTTFKSPLEKRDIHA